MQRENDIQIIPYSLSRHPARVSPDIFFNTPEQGSNCQLLAVSFTLARGYLIDPTFRSSEIYEDMIYTDPVLNPATIKTGDIVGLTTEANHDPKKNHVGIAYKDPERGLYLVHNGREIGEATVSPLALLQKQDRYQKISCIKRPKIKLPDNPYTSILINLGFEYLV